MNTKRYIITSVVVWIVYSILGWLLNGVIINTPNIPGMKTAEEMGAGSIIVGLLGGLIFSFVFSFIFTKGYEGKGVMEGFRYGLYIGLLLYVPLWFIYVAYFTYPLGYVWGFTIGSFVIVVLLGIIAALFYKPKPKVEQPAA
jgi:ABC-type antimicrobial peptide transport system permease subunit